MNITLYRNKFHKYYQKNPKKTRDEHNHNSTDLDHTKETREIKKDPLFVARNFNEFLIERKGYKETNITQNRFHNNYQSNQT